MSSRAPTVEPGESGPFTPAEARHAQRVALIAWGIFGSAWMAMIGGAPWVTFVRERLGISLAEYGLLSAVPSIAVIAQLPGSFLVEYWRQRRKLFLIASGASRLVWFVVAALPWIVPSNMPGVRFTVLLFLILLWAVLSHLSTPAWFAWFAEMVPERVRGRYLGVRAAAATVTGVVVGLIIPRIVDWNSSFAVFTGIFIAAGVFGFTDIALFIKVREPAMPQPQEEMRNAAAHAWKQMLAPCRDRKFWGYLLYQFSETFTFVIAMPYFMLLALEYLKINNFWSTVYVSTIPAICTALTLPTWGRMCDRFGYKPLLRFGMLASLAYPVFWLLAMPRCYIPFAFGAALIGGLLTPSVQAADMSMMYELTPQRNRSSYIAWVMIASSIAASLASILFGVVAEQMKTVNLPVGWMHWHNFHIIMLISFVARICHVVFIIPRLPEENPRSTRELAKFLVNRPLDRMLTGISSISGKSRTASESEMKEE